MIGQGCLPFRRLHMLAPPCCAFSLRTSRHGCAGHRTWVQMGRLLRPLAGEHEPAVEDSRPMGTAATWPETHCRGGAFDDLTQANLFVDEEPWQAYAVGLACAG